MKKKNLFSLPTNKIAPQNKVETFKIKFTDLSFSIRRLYILFFQSFEKSLGPTTNDDDFYHLLIKNQYLLELHHNILFIMKKIPINHSQQYLCKT